MMLYVYVNVKRLQRGRPPMSARGSDPEDFRRLVRAFAEAGLAPHVEEWDRDSRCPVHLVPKMGELGLFGLEAPEEFGGAGMGHEGFSYLCVAIEELGRVDQAMGITLEAGVGLGINPIQTYGSQEQKEKWLPDLLQGKALAGFGLTEPEAGSDAAATKTRAVLDNGEWVVNGAKAFITNSGTDITSVVTVTAKTGELPDGRPEISAIIVPNGTDGFIVEPPYRKLGWHISDTHGLTFEGARVPEANLLGERGHGFKQLLKTLDDGRIAIAALAVGCLQRMLEETTRYSQERLAFGKPIATYQGVSFQVSDIAVMTEAARALVYKAAWLREQQAAGKRSVAEVKQAAAIAKLYATESAVTATRIATQVFGGN